MEKIKETNTYKHLKSMSNIERTNIFDGLKSVIEQKLNCDLIEHKYTDDLKNENSEYLTFSVKTRTGFMIKLMEFRPRISA